MSRKSAAPHCSASSTRLAYKAIEGATVFCKLRGNPYVELVHWLHQILQQPGLRPAPHRPPLRARRRRGWRADITDALDRLPRGATSISDLSTHIENAVERGWVYAHADVRRARRCAPATCSSAC